MGNALIQLLLRAAICEYWRVKQDNPCRSRRIQQPRAASPSTIGTSNRGKFVSKSRKAQRSSWLDWQRLACSPVPSSCGNNRIGSKNLVIKRQSFERCPSDIGLHLLPIVLTKPRATTG